MRFKNVSMLSLTALLSLLLTACATAPFKVKVAPVLPKLESYSPAFVGQAADEFDRMPPACDRQEPNATCSAVKRLAIDHGTLRKRIREAQSKEEEVK